MVTTASCRIALLQGGVVSAALLLTGCATVQTSVTKHDAQSAGMTYFLPRRLVKVTATSTPVNAAKLAKALAKAGEDLTAALAAKSAAADVADQAKARLDALPAAAPGRDRQAGKVALAQADLALATKAADDLDKQHRDLAEALRNLPPAGTCTYEAKVELMAAEPDPSERLVASPRHNWLRDDTVKLNVSANGLLTSANAVAADRTGDILVEAAGVVGMSTAKAVTKGQQMSLQPGGAGAPYLCGDHAQTIIEIFDPLDEPAGRHAVDQFPFEVSMSVDPPGAKPLAGAPAAKRLYVGAPSPPLIGLYFRTPTPVWISLLRTDGGSTRVIDSSVALLPQAGPIGFVPMNSSAFVKTTDDVQFVDGSLSSWSTDRPSEVLEVVRLPVKIATALISVPAQLLSVKVDYSSKAKSLAEAQQAQIETQLKLQKLKLCLAQAQADGAAPDKCLAAD